MQNSNAVIDNGINAQQKVKKAKSQIANKTVRFFKVGGVHPVAL
jgi:hypothetical protein